MKKFTPKMRIALSLLFSISMASASQRSWRDYSRHDAQKFVTDAYESGKEYLNKYAQPASNYVQNNPYKTGAGVAVAGGLVYGGFAVRAYMARNRKTFRETASNAGNWIADRWENRRYWFGRNAAEKAKLEKQKQEYSEVIADIAKYKKLEAKRDSLNDTKKSELNTLYSKLKNIRETLITKMNKSNIEVNTLNALIKWNN